MGKRPDERRGHTRMPLCVEVKISHPIIGEKIVQTRDFSEGGIFVLIDNSSGLPPIGEYVNGQVQGMVEEAAVVKMKVVRVEKDGLGLQYMKEET